eukprot:Gb_07077 [translate_table: standard]
MSHQQFVKRYGFLLLQHIASQDTLTVCIAILHQFDISPIMYQVGFTKLFFRTGEIGRLEDIRARTLCGITAVQKCFRGYRVQSYFKKLKRVTILVQSMVKGVRARKEYRLLKERYKAAVTIQKEMKRRTARQEYIRTREMVILVQAALRGWLARKRTEIIRQQSWEEASVVDISAERSDADVHTDHTDEIFNKVNLITSDGGLPKASQELQAKEMKLLKKGLEDKTTVQIQPSFLSELQSRVLAAEAALKEKECENAVLYQRLQQHEVRWSEYEVKMASIEEMWQNQITTLHQSIAAAKKTLAVDRPLIQHTKQDDVSSICTGISRQRASRHILPHDEDAFDWDDATSAGTKTPDHHQTPQKLLQNPNIGLARELDEGRVAVSHLVKEFEHRTQVFNDDSEFLVEVKSGQTQATLNPDEELRKLKQRFDLWKKYFKGRLRETKVILQKLGGTDSSGEKTKRKWWGKRSS